MSPVASSIPTSAPSWQNPGADDAQQAHTPNLQPHHSGCNSVKGIQEGQTLRRGGTHQDPVVLIGIVYNSLGDQRHPPSSELGVGFQPIGDLLNVRIGTQWVCAMLWALQLCPWVVQYQLLGITSLCPHQLCICLFNRWLCCSRVM